MEIVTRSQIERAVAAGLRATVAVHGPISFEQVGSAAKRATSEVLGLLQDLESGKHVDVLASLTLDELDLDALDARFDQPLEEMEEMELAGDRP